MDPFHHPLVRDLAWLIAGSPLMAPGTPGLAVPPAGRMKRMADDARPWLADLDRRPDELERWMTRHRSPRLGHHAEALMEFWLRRAPGIRFIAGRQTITDGGQTRGDLDLLFEDDVRGQRVHWELAVKFYLRATPSPDWDQWIGPDSRDRLDLKLRRIIDQQLPLGRHPLATHGASGAVQSEAFLRGWLFTPPGSDGPSATGSAQGHGRGWWLRHGERDVPATSRASRFAVLPRLAWMPPARLKPGGTPPVSGNEVAQHLDRHFRTAIDAVLITEVQRDREGWWAEVARGFVVHPTWPRPHEPPSAG